jgi:hypothetical protein
MLESSALHVDEVRLTADSHDLEDMSAIAAREKIQVELAGQTGQRSINIPVMLQDLLPMCVQPRVS